MTHSSIGYSSAESAHDAGCELAESVLKGFDNERPDAVIVFASSRFDYGVLLKALSDGCTPGVLVGCSSAGEFISDHRGTGSACAVGIKSDDIQFAGGVGKGISVDRDAVITQLLDGFSGLENVDGRFRSAMLLTDALAGYADDLVERFNVRTGASYRLFGGGAGDDAHFNRTHVFWGTEAYTDAAVALEILSKKPVGIGVQHGWQPVGQMMRVTESEGMRLISVNAMPAVEAFAEHALEQNTTFDTNEPMPFFLHNVLGIETPSGFKLRVPLAVNDDGSIVCAAEIPTGSTVTFMKATVASAADAAITAIESAKQQIGNGRPAVTLFFDCVATRLRTGADFSLELDALQLALDGGNYVGCNTYGQIARAEGQFSGFHNCTATVCVLPE